jgi:hypothetical protein
MPSLSSSGEMCLLCVPNISRLNARSLSFTPSSRSTFRKRSPTQLPWEVLTSPRPHRRRLSKPARYPLPSGARRELTPSRQLCRSRSRVECCARRPEWWYETPSVRRPRRGCQQHKRRELFRNTRFDTTGSQWFMVSMKPIPHIGDVDLRAPPQNRAGRAAAEYFDAIAAAESRVAPPLQNRARATPQNRVARAAVESR